MGPAALRPDDDAPAEPERAEAELRAVASAPPPAIDSLTLSSFTSSRTHCTLDGSCRVEDRRC